MREEKWDFDSLYPTATPRKNHLPIILNMAVEWIWPWFQFLAGRCPEAFQSALEDLALKNSSICRLIMNADFACVCDLQALCETGYKLSLEIYSSLEQIITLWEKSLCFQWKHC